MQALSKDALCVTGRKFETGYILVYVNLTLIWLYISTLSEAASAYAPMNEATVEYGHNHALPCSPRPFWRSILEGHSRVQQHIVICSHSTTML